ncbi:hypothetical protein, variant [Salpingoeca rosetta]|uniref:RING-type domain-containing protein n=1 Tax=Salpingoeca rosetta (strain ATCC 50818 / BSB-021) TaxID=946362 RepID=F2U7F1_SALR5|nr:hypothetical protein, variant [Salpingoeca rosetta]EGD83367.1 hypothetical protein, variant [Salpingoeca rosetta]|eukprot:XP_004994871.1 hypothetical protein, variant [Salpingoeca rosetta]
MREGWIPSSFALSQAGGQGGELAPSSLVRFFHSWLHLKSDFAPVDVPTQGAFNPQNEEYYTSLVIIAGIFLAASVLGIIAVLIVLCCNCSRRWDRTNSYYTQLRRFRKLKIAAVTLGISAILLMVACIYANVETTDAVTDTISHVERLDNKYNKALTSVSNLGSDATDPLNMAQRLQRDLASAPQDVQRALQDIVSGTQTFQSSLSSVVRSAPTFEFDSFYSDARTYNHYRSIAEFGLVAFAVFALILLLVALACRSYCQLITSIIISAICLVILSAVVGIESAAAVGVSDVCMKPTTFLIHQFAEDDAYVSYYLFCNTTSPFQPDINQAQSEAQEGVLAAQLVVNYTRENAPQFQSAAIALQQGLNDLQQQLPKVAASVDCATFWPTYKRVIDGVCNPMTTNLAILSASRLAGCILFLVVLVLVSYASLHFGLPSVRDPEEAGGLISDENNVQPLLFFHQVQYRSTSTDDNNSSSSTRTRRRNNDNSNNNTTGGGEGGGPSAPPIEVDGGDGNDDDDDEDLLCKICVARPVNIRLNCGHCICSQCVEEISDTCPWCRDVITSRDRLIFP